MSNVPTKPRTQRIFRSLRALQEMPTNPMTDLKKAYLQELAENAQRSADSGDFMGAIKVLRGDH